MRRAERLFRLVNEMRTRGVSRANELAEHLEVSVSTIYRDIAHLQASGMPIEGEAGVGYLLRPGFDLPNTTFTHDQIDALAVGLAFVESTGDPALVSAAREVRAKIQAGLPAPEERKLADAPYYSLQSKNSAPADVGVLREAIRTQQVVEITYTNASGSTSTRRLCPLVIWNLTDGWMFSAWCELRQDFRTFRFDRIAQLTVTNEHFIADEDTSLTAFMEREGCEEQV
ncbi:YafY family protein [Pseudovibrio sp. JE062]|uniref:helix-turn-helix transcriptional regulator n=1 Tax=Pseudovibrio sp. JE062 TaxID=439495 RepID=UPI000186C52B|nr:YafY family protein [Pseudovibrio sp. JE062]EEA94688.1 helix-turn-helix, type 11 domain protein [Pseudovibrio sp. JE062]